MNRSLSELSERKERKEKQFVHFFLLSLSLSLHLSKIKMSNQREHRDYMSNAHGKLYFRDPLFLFSPQKHFSCTSYIVHCKFYSYTSVCIYNLQYIDHVDRVNTSTSVLHIVFCIWYVLSHFIDLLYNGCFNPLRIFGFFQQLCL